MPLIKCPDCGTEISDQAPTCLKCGKPLNQAQNTKTIAGDISINRIEQTAKKWKKVKLLGWLGIFLGSFMAVNSTSKDFSHTLGIMLVTFGVVGLIASKFGNWWDRG